jgi:hypothetical protein
LSLGSVSVDVAVAGTVTVALAVGIRQVVCIVHFGRVETESRVRVGVRVVALRHSRLVGIDVAVVADSRLVRI